MGVSYDGSVRLVEPALPATSDELQSHPVLARLALSAPTGSNSSAPYDDTPKDPRQVELWMNYARSSSAVPESLHGIFWLDERASVLPLTDFPQDAQVEMGVGKAASYQVLASFGEGEGVVWDRQRRCLGAVPVGRGSRHWAYADTPMGRDAVDDLGRTSQTLCFKEGSDNAIDILTAYNHLARAFLHVVVLSGLLLPHCPDRGRQRQAYRALRKVFNGCQGCPG